MTPAERSREIARIEDEIRRQQALVMSRTHQLQRTIAQQRVRELMRELRGLS